ncbi:MAG TPA: hypothetical protein VK858_18940, partial [Longimicrobiales bacterium]|nr:hypothetical protein [Longimicrobiales bacterium]
MTTRRTPLAVLALTAALVSSPLSGQERSLFSLLDAGGRSLPADGTVTNGSLTPDDFVSGDGSRVQAWQLELAAGAPVQIDLRSEDFDALLHVLGPGLDGGLRDDDGGGDLDSRICFVPADAGTYTVVAGSLNGGDGAFTLVAGPPEGGACPPGSGGMDMDPGSLEMGWELDEIVPDGPLALPGDVRFRFSGGEPRTEGRPLRAWTIRGSAGDRIALTHVAPDEDTYLYLIGPGLPEPLRDDDGAGDLNARLCVELPENGEYVVLAGPFSDPTPGTEYVLEARKGAEADAVCRSYASSPARTVERILAFDTGGRVLRVGEEVRGTLDGIQLHPETGGPIQVWRLDGEPGARVFVDVVSESFDPTLRVVWAGLDAELYNDDAGDGCNSRLEFVLPAEGPVLVLPGAWSDEGSGPFTLRASVDPGPLEVGGCGSGADLEGFVGAENAAWEMVGRLGEPSESLAAGNETLAELDATAPVIQGIRARSWRLEVEGPGALVVEAVSDDFDPVLYVTGPG